MSAASVTDIHAQEARGAGNRRDGGVELAERVRARAVELGFDLVGITTLGPAETSAEFDAWIAAGYAGEMAYLERGAEKRRDTRRPFEGVRSAVVVALSYGGREPPGPVARYARGDDYHDLMVDRLNALHRWIESERGTPIRGKAYVDTGPILERDLARRAGLGWFGKNTMLVNPGLGSFFFLGALLLDLDLAPDAPFEMDRCGTCTRCLEACPTQAFVAPHVLDATRCISYLTIEQRGEIPSEFHAAIAEGGMVYGCDVCQDVCPYNRKFALELAEAAFAPRAVLSGKDARSLALDLLSMSQPEFSAAFKGSPMKRAKLSGLKRNAAAVLGVAGAPEEAAALIAALKDPALLVRASAAQALARIGSPAGVAALQAQAEVESDESVLAALRSALGPLED